MGSPIVSVYRRLEGLWLQSQEEVNSRPNLRPWDSRTSLNHKIVEQETYQLFMKNITVILVQPDKCGCGILIQPQCPSERRMKKFVDGHFVNSVWISPWPHRARENLWTSVASRWQRGVPGCAFHDGSPVGQTLHSSVRVLGQHSVTATDHNPTEQLFSQAHEQLDASSLKTKNKREKNYTTFLPSKASRVLIYGNLCVTCSCLPKKTAGFWNGKTGNKAFFG